MRYALLLLLLLASCTNTIRHEIVIDLGLEDECLFAFPACSPGGYHCEDSDGIRQSACQVACLAARDLTCEPDGPFCTQTLGDEEPFVPVLCISK